ncbi:ABC transporter substrate-binding protein [Streptomyces cocklensis]|uniref:Sulfonate transport system substrate-binding protein n=1 Tax=Actinacidiphila cocklensis TaxID=887465 RepID=A0A9W4DIC9_9ACTN|nr:ABC transporter substrate-binding protein [Actinacidiphila cocklensis]MDD1062542.1 ABC transporter substrate-binding protein [Actinacidiphila cocklensis]CAG6391906.1 Sulfonate transport system substrate-binding protein [Actinacidiphila cocklensis]
MSRSASPAPGLNRRLFLNSLLGSAAAAGLSACAGKAAAGPALSSTAALPTAVPTGTSLKIAAYQGAQQLQLKGAGVDKLPFTVSSWANIGAGPDVINAFRAHSLDLANNAGIPPIQAHYQGYDAKIVAINITRKPSYVFATAPHSGIQAVSGFKGKRLAFSQGQAQGVVLLRALKEAGLAYSDVHLVPLTSNQFLTALQARQVDIAPLGLSQVPAYLSKYAAKGAHTITTDVIDLLSLLWAPASVLADSAKAAAIADFIPRWAQGLVWAYEHPDEWNQRFYVETQNLTLAEAQAITKLSNKPLFPASWGEAITWEQQTADLLAEGGFVKPFKVASLFDRRFEGLAAKSVAATYRS